jgi:hypothetical protein
LEFECLPEEQPLDAVGCKYNNKFKIGSEVYFLLIFEELAVVVVDLIPNLEAVHEDAISLALDYTYLCLCGLLISLFCFFCDYGIDIYVDGDMLHHLFLSRDVSFCLF